MKRIIIFLVMLLLFVGCSATSNIEDALLAEGYERYDSGHISYIKNLNGKDVPEFTWSTNWRDDAEERTLGNRFIVNYWGREDMASEAYYFNKGIYTYGARTGSRELKDCLLDIETGTDTTDQELLDRYQVTSRCGDQHIEMAESMIRIFNEELEKLEISKESMSQYLDSLESKES